MITIYNEYTGEEYKCYQSAKMYATKSTFCTDFISNRWFQKWGAIILYSQILSTMGNKAQFQITLRDGWAVKGVN